MISKTELKKRQKVRERDAAKKEKADKAGPPPAAGKKAAGSSEAAEKDLTPNQVGGCPRDTLSKDTQKILILGSTLKSVHEPSTSCTSRARPTPTRLARQPIQTATTAANRPP